MNILVSLAIVLLASYGIVRLAKKTGVPPVVGLILLGIFFGVPHVRQFLFGTETELIFFLGNLGLFALLFLAGLESSLKSMYKERYDALFIAFFAAIVPFLLGFFVFYLIGFPLSVALIVGICMSITAEATKARVLIGLKKLKTKVGSAMMGAGLIDDTIGFVLFFSVTLLLGKIFLGEDLAILGAIMLFFVGLISRKLIGRENRKVVVMEKGMLHLLVPFFFVSMGIHFEISSLLLNPFLAAIIVVLAIIGKLAGASLAKPFTKLRIRQLHLIGWGMNSRGAIELAFALIAFRNQLIPPEIYSSLVFMALFTTLLFPFILTKIIKSDPKIMD